MKNKGNLIGLTSGLFWGISTVVLGLALSKLVIASNGATLTVTWVHDSISALILTLALIFSGRFKVLLKTLKSREGFIIVLAALLGGPIGMGAYFIAINYLSPSIAAAISSLYPAFGVLLAYLLLSEKITKKQVVGLIISVGAIMLMSISNQLSVSNLWLGLLSISLCVIGWGSEAVIISYALKKDVSSTVALTIRQITSTTFYGLVVMPFIKYESLATLALQKDVLLIIFAASIFATLSYLFYYKAIDMLGASRAMALNISYPAWAFIFQLILFKTFVLSEMILVCLILLGVYIGIEKD